jgi:hypothetical protein
VDLQNAYLEGTRLQGAEFQNAQLQGTNLFQADLRGLKLNDAHLEGAMLNQAQLQGASLAGAQMQGASLQSAVLHGAGLRDAQLQGAALDYAQLQGATLIYTALEGASLEGALLEGAVLDDARMPGVVLSSADLTNASLQKVLTWRATGESVKGDPRVVAPQITAMRPESVRSRSTREATANCVGFNPCDWTADTFAALQRLIVDLLPRGSRRDRALNRIAILDPDTPMPAERSMENLKVKLAQSPPSADDYDKSLAESFRQIGCNKDDAPYVIRGWLRDHRLAGRGPAWRALAVAFLDPANCPGARGLSDQEMADLRTMRDRAAP